MAKDRSKSEQLATEIENQKKYEEDLRNEIQLIENEIKKASKQREENLKEKKRWEKKYNELKNSRSWRYTSPIRGILNLFRRNQLKDTELNDQSKIIQELTRQQRELTNAYLSTVQTASILPREQTEQILPNKKKLKEEQLLIVESNSEAEVIGKPPKSNLLPSKEEIQKAKENGSMIDIIDNIIEKRKEIDKEYTNVFRNIIKAHRNEPEDIRKNIYSKLINVMKLEEITEPMMNKMLQFKMPLKQISSFRVCMTLHLRRRQLNRFGPEWALENKKNAYNFVDRLGVKRPWRDNDTKKFSEIEKKERIVIKPAIGSGSKGCYIIIRFNRIRDVSRCKYLEGWRELEKSIKDDLETGRVKGDRWIVEELILEDETTEQPGRDFKFYSFYGKIALIREVYRYPKTMHCWWSPEGNIVKTGRYDDESFKGEGFEKYHLDYVSYISSQIPAPFFRIDFLKSTNELIFGEFTPKIGNYNQFNAEYDEMLGEYFLDAEGRLKEDLLNGKDFSHYNEFINSIKNNH